MILEGASAWRRLAAGIAAVALATAGLVLGAGPAQADGVCGANYNTIGSVSVNTEAPKTLLSKINVQYNPGNGYWCAVNRNSTGNPADHMSVCIKRPADAWSDAICDSGPFQEYAGPVYRFWTGQCIDVRAGTVIGTKSGSATARVCR
jgi:hypothetical protein